MKYVQSKQYNPQNVTKRRHVTYFTPFSNVSFVEFEQVNVSWVVEILKYKLEIFKAVLLSKNVVKSRSSSFHDNNEIIQRRRKHLSVQSKKTKQKQH